MGKLVTYGGAATGILLIGYYLGRRSRSKTVQLGGSGVAGIDYAVAMPRLGVKVASQVAQAQAGSWIDDYRKVSDISVFSNTPAFNVAAYYTAAWWTAVAARLLRSRTLGARAASLAAKGSATYGIPGSSFFTGSVSDIMKDGADAVSKAAGSAATEATRKLVKGIAGRLKAMADPGSVATAREAVEDKAALTRTIEQTGRDVADLPGAIIKKGEDLLPGGGHGWKWWTLRVGGAVGATVALAILARWGWKKVRASKQAKQIEQKPAEPAKEAA